MIDIARRKAWVVNAIGLAAADRVVTLAGCWLVVVALVAIASPVLVPHDPFAPNFSKSLAAPEWAHPMGFDVLGRDVLSRVMVASRVSMLVGPLSILLAFVLGVSLGVLAGFIRGRTDEIIMRLVDIQMTLPALLLALAILYVFGPGFSKVVIAIALARSMVFARVSRGLVMSLREEPFIEAARATGATTWGIIRSHILPNLMTPLVTLATIGVAGAMLTEASLSFLGLGIQSPDVSWGQMLAGGRDYITVAWWIAIWPGVAITLTALSLNVVATWVRAASDPLRRGRIAHQGVQRAAPRLTR